MEATPNMLLVKWERIRLALNFFMIPQSVLSRQNHASVILGITSAVRTKVLAYKLNLFMISRRGDQ